MVVGPRVIIRSIVGLYIPNIVWRIYDGGTRTVGVGVYSDRCFCPMDLFLRGDLGYLSCCWDRKVGSALELIFGNE